MKEEINLESASAKVIFDKGIYSIYAIKRALSGYTEDFFVKIEEKAEGFEVTLEAKNKGIDIKNTLKELYNSVLEEDVRYNIESETKTIRDMIYEKALKQTQD